MITKDSLRKVWGDLVTSSKFFLSLCAFSQSAVIVYNELVPSYRMNLPFDYKKPGPKPNI